MINNRRSGQYHIDDTQFIFRTNFSGDPNRDTGKYPNDQRKANVVIPSEEQAKDLMKDGIDVKKYQPKPRNEGDPEPDPIYYTKVTLQYRKKDGSPVEYPPEVYLVTDPDEDPVLMSEDTIDELDHIRIKNVNVVVRTYIWDPVGGKKTLKIKTMYVEQDLDDDPYASRYRKKRTPRFEDEEVF